MQSPTAALTKQLLEWVALEPRTYGEAMEAWRTSCPRLSIWEDALAEGLIKVRTGGSLGESIVVLTALGEAVRAEGANISS